MLHRPLSAWTWDPRLRSARTRLSLGFLHRCPYGMARIERALRDLALAHDPSLEAQQASLRARPNSERAGRTINSVERAALDRSRSDFPRTGSDGALIMT